MFIEAVRFACRTPAGCYVGRSSFVGELTCARCTPLECYMSTSTYLYDERLERQSLSESYSSIRTPMLSAVAFW
jgi:hypothetical protein